MVDLESLNKELQAANQKLYDSRTGFGWGSKEHVDAEIEVQKLKIKIALAEYPPQMHEDRELINALIDLHHRAADSGDYLLLAAGRLIELNEEIKRQKNA